MYGTSRTVGPFYLPYACSFSLAPPASLVLAFRSRDRPNFRYARRNVQHHRLRGMTSPMQLSVNSRAGEMRVLGEKFTDHGWMVSTESTRTSRPTFSQCTAIRIFHENISDPGRGSTCQRRRLPVVTTMRS